MSSVSIEQQVQTGAPEEAPEAAMLLPRPARATGWFVVMAVVYLLATLLFFVGYGVYVAINNPGISPAEAEAMAQTNLLAYLPAMYLVQFVFLVPLVWAISHFSTQSAAQTLAIKPVAGKSIVFWLGAYAVYQAAAMIIHTLIDIPPDAFVEQLASSRHLPTALTIVVLAPVLEELVFRGYLFKAWRHSWLGASGTILLTSVLFISLHVGQYGLVILGQLFIFSIILGLSREKTGSIITPWLLHTVNNLFSVILLMYLGWL